MDTVVIIEADVERDRKTCLTLDARVTGANQALAQWLINHPQYPNTTVAAWLGCGETRIRTLRKWAENGFEGAAFYNEARKNRDQQSRLGANPPLKSLDNSEDIETPSHPSDFQLDKSLDSPEINQREDSVVADPAIIEDNAIHSLLRCGEHARYFRKLFKLSAFDREAESRINSAIEQMIHRWRLAQATLTKKGNGHGEA